MKTYNDIEVGNRKFNVADKAEVEAIKMAIDAKAILLSKLQKELKQHYEELNELEVE